MLDDPMFTAELIAEKREREDAKWRASQTVFPAMELHNQDLALFAQYLDLKAREAWHDDQTLYPRHRSPFADCPSSVCNGTRPVPR